MTAVYRCDIDETDYVLMVPDEVSTFSSQWILDLACSYHIYCREELFDSLDSSEGTVHLLDGLSYAIKDIRIVSLQIYDGA